jgi:hypothetical protein
MAENIEIKNKKIETMVKFVIDDTFKNLVLIHKDYLKKYLTKICIKLGYYFEFDNYILQLQQNKYRDIFSLLVLLLPYYELNKSNEINNLGELFYKNNKNNKLSSTYHYDHYIENDDDIIKYFETSIMFIEKTFGTVCNKLTPNWLNIFPYTMNNYKKSSVYLEFEEYRKNKNFPEYKYYDYSNFKLGYHTLFGVIKKFLYDDIKDIKWMIYDIKIKNKVYPSIIRIVENLGIENIINEPWEKLSKEKQKIIKDKWYKTTKGQKISEMKFLILFYLRWEQDNEKLEEIITEPNCMKIIKPNLDNIYDINNDDNENYFYTIGITMDYKKSIDYCIKTISHKIDIENLYTYIYICSQQFRYTWYGYCCLDNNKRILNTDNYFKKYVNSINKFKDRDLNDSETFYVTPKMTYNFFKSLLHIEYNAKFKPLTNTCSWDNLTTQNKIEIIDKLNWPYENLEWFDIRKNIQRVYDISNTEKRAIKKIQRAINNIFYNTEWLSIVIFECLVYNGIFTYFKYNPEATDNLLLPDKNKFNAEWEQKLLSHIKIEDYGDSYHFLDNKKLNLHDDIIKENIVKKSKWYTNFGADWIAQIQVFHHFINQRIMYVTGATGAGKSTVFPFMILYALKIINYNNNGKVFCTQPRIQPTVGNATRMADSLGIPIKKNKDKNKNKEDSLWIKSDIDYLQFKYAGDSIADNLFHPTLRLLTDGYLYSMIKNDYILKKRKNDDNDLNSFTENNLFDVLLIDESHEHNPYMDMILTMCKFALYINNEITIGIISATMEDDEATYRKYFEIIDDNWKAPINLDCIQTQYAYNRNRLDRRIHLSVPFGGMNFDVDVEDKLKESEIDIVKRILTTSSKGDILIFKPGTAEIEELVKKINENTPSNVLAIPFIRSINEEFLNNIVKKIQEDDVRKSIRYPKKYSINQINDIPPQDLLPEGTYTRFIIIATNIAEASITIDTLKYVIDDGKQKVMFYDGNTNQSKLLTIDIAIPNQKQRKGRIGRNQPGKAYFTYDISKLKSKVLYKLCSDNINDKILDLLTLSDNHFFNSENNPYIVSTLNNLDDNNLEKIPIFLQKQYSYIDTNNYNDYVDILFYRTKPDNINYNDIIYPYSDGKYDLDTLIDEQGKFFIIHPNETQFERNENLEIIKKDDDYQNKVLMIIKYFKMLNIIDNNNKLTNYGRLMTSCVQLFELEIEQVLLILDMLSFDYKVKDKKSEIFRNIIWFCVFINSNKLQNMSLPKNEIVNSDFLAKANIIPSRFLYSIDLIHISEYLNDDLSNLSDLIEFEVNKLIELVPTNSLNILLIKEMLINYYKIKIKIEILEELFNPLSTIIYYPNKQHKFIKGQIKKNSQLLKNINVNYFQKISNSDINFIKSLNNYEQICFFICKNKKKNILLKIIDTPYYINYFNRNLYSIFQISYYISPFNNKKRIITNVNNDYRNNIIFYLSSDDANKITNIMWIPNKIIYLLQKAFPVEIIRNNFIQKNKLIQTYGEEETNNILKKIDIINNYIIKV